MKFEVRNGCFAYKGGREILKNISFTVEGGKLLAILGANGIGKTTLLKCMMGLLRWTCGRSLIDGKDISGLPPQKIWQKIAYIPQAKLSKFAFTGLEMALMGRSAHLGAFEQPKDKDIAVAENALEEIGVSHLRNKRCNQMSGRELQMVFIARALAVEPRLMILDEPESGLDFRNQLIILELLDRLVHEKKLSAVINTHYPAHAMKIADHTLMLAKQGRYFYGRTGDIINIDNMRSAFDVNVLVNSVEIEGRQYDDIIPMSVVWPASDSVR